MICRVNLTNGTKRKILDVIYVSKTVDKNTSEDNIWICIRNKKTGVTKEIEYKSKDVEYLAVREPY